MDDFEQRMKAFNDGASGGEPSSINGYWADFEAGRATLDGSTSGATHNNEALDRETAFMIVLGAAAIGSFGFPLWLNAFPIGVGIPYLWLFFATASLLAWIRFGYSNSEEALGFSIWPVYFSALLSLLTLLAHFSSQVFMFAAAANVALLWFHVPTVMNVIKHYADESLRMEVRYLSVWRDMVFWRSKW